MKPLLQLHLTAPLRTAALAALAFAIGGCEPGQEPPPSASPAKVQLTEERQKQLSQSTRAAWHMAEPAVDEAMNSAFELLDAVSGFLDNPTDQALAQAQAEWRSTWASYQPLHLYGTMADYAPQTFNLLRQVFYAVAARPIEPGYLDSVGDYAYSGLVHDISLPLSATTLREQHGRTQEEDVVLGIFAIEFMLFGEPERPRTARDYNPRDQLTQAEQAHGYSAPEELPENRRRQLLLTQAQLLVEDFHRMQILWQPQPPESFYRAYVSLPAEQRRQLLLDASLLELKRSQSQLEGVSAEANTPTSSEGSDAAVQRATGAVPAQVLTVRLEYLVRVLEALQVENEVVQQVMLAYEALSPEAIAKDAAWDALQVSIDGLAAAQGSGSPGLEPGSTSATGESASSPDR